MIELIPQIGWGFFSLYFMRLILLQIYFIFPWNGYHGHFNCFKWIFYHKQKKNKGLSWWLQKKTSWNIIILHLDKNVFVVNNIVWNISSPIFRQSQFLQLQVNWTFLCCFKSFEVSIAHTLCSLFLQEFPLRACYNFQRQHILNPTRKKNSSKGSTICRSASLLATSSSSLYSLTKQLYPLESHLCFTSSKLKSTFSVNGFPGTIKEFPWK